MALSRSAVDKLGDRLRKGTAAEADWDLLEELRDLRRQHLDDVLAVLRTELGLAATGRIKTTNTLIEKLERGRSRLSRIDDVAGARLKVDGGRDLQDILVSGLQGVWPDARVKDRRAEPMHGYRAVHVIVHVAGWPLEIQVRTLRQDRLANILESIADRWGRQIRYGRRPEGADLRAFPEYLATRDEFLSVVFSVADAVAEAEDRRLRLDRGELHVSELSLPISDEEAMVDALVDGLQGMVDGTDRR